MTKEDVKILVNLLTNAADEIKYADLEHETQFAYNEGIEDLIILVESKLDKLAVNKTHI